MLRNRIKNEENMLYREAVPKDEDGKMLFLMKESFNLVFSLEWFRWFNFLSPYGNNRLYVVEDKIKNKLVAGYGLLPYKLKINNKIVKGSLCTNGMTHPDYRMKGLFTNLGKFALSREENFGSKISLAVSNKNAIKGHLKIGWKIISDLNLMAKRKNLKRKYNSTKIKRFDKRYDVLFQEIVNKCNFAIVKDYQFMNWRYDRPDKHYQIYSLSEKNKPKGFIVLQYSKERKSLSKPEKGAKAVIVDIFASNRDVFNDLLNAAETFAKDCKELICWQITNSLYADWFSERGFQLKEDKRTLLLKNNFGPEINITHLNWWFALGDNDVY